MADAQNPISQSAKTITFNWDLFRSIIDNYPATFVVYDAQRRFLYVNKYGVKLSGFSEQEHYGHTDEEIYPPAITNGYVPILQQVVETRKSWSAKTTMKIGEQTIPVSLIYVPILDERGEIKHILSFMDDLTESKKIEKIAMMKHDNLEIKVTQRTMELFEANIQLQQEVLERRGIQEHVHISNELLKLLAKCSSRKEYIGQVVKLLHGYVGCRCVGLRMVNETGNIPYEAYVGFSKEFWESENWLSLETDHCACMRVINGESYPQDSALMTAQGSFCCQNSLKFFAGLTPEEKREFRGVCVKHGFASIVIVPIRHKNEIIGAIHLADEKENQLPPRIVKDVEELAYSVGEGIRKFDLEDRIRQDYEIQKVINELLRLSLSNINLTELCQQTLGRLLAISWFDFYPLGSIHLLEEDSGELVLQAHLGLPPRVREKYRRVSLSDYVDSGHNLEEKIQLPFRNYRLPILLAEQTLGVITFSVRETYAHSWRKEAFLKSVADVLAGVIQHKRLANKLAEMNELLARLFSSSSYMIAFMDTGFNFIQVNEVYAQADGHTPDYYVGKNHFTLFPNAENKAIFKKVIETGRSYTTYAKPFSYVDHPERGISYWDWNLQPLKDSAGKVEGLLLTLVDVTKRQQTEEELLKAQKELSETKRLSDIGMLAATVAHELRNPLAVIRLAAYSVKKKADNPLLEPHLANIEKKIMESDQIINNLLYYSRLKRPNYKKISIHEVLQECVAAAEEKFRDYQTIVHKKYEQVRDIFVEADPLQMKEVFNNMLDNAYESLAEKKGLIEVSAKYDVLKKEIAVVFKDTGVGIDPLDLKKIADPFFTRKTKGTGLGLTVSYQIINLHRGTIGVESSKGAGTTFLITLPVGRQKPREKESGA